MDSTPESMVGTSRDRAHQIITGKRTDDQHRLCSPSGMSETTSSSYGGGEGNSTCDARKLSYYTSGQSPTITSEEEEDMANCLIMLAQSVSPSKEHKPDQNWHITKKLNNPSLTEIAATTPGGKCDSYNYECKTCNRAFPSFQALGGHRASHKKPKLTIEDENYVAIKTEFSRDYQPKLLVKSPSPPSGFIQTGYKNSKGKIHECSICGLEFLSGQALGGHMRRHRTTPVSSNQISVSMNMNNRSVHHNTGKSPVLSLDLNLPAPEVVDDVHSNFQFTAISAQHHLVFSAAALVDCHY